MNLSLLTLPIHIAAPSRQAYNPTASLFTYPANTSVWPPASLLITSMFSNILRRLRRQNSQRRFVRVPPDLRTRDSFSQPFPHVSEGGYTRYYQELLHQRHTREESHRAPNSTPNPMLTSPHTHTQTPSASSSRSVTKLSRYRRTTKKKSALMRQSGLERIQEAPPGHQRSVRKRKRDENLRGLVEAQAVAERAAVVESLTGDHDTSRSFLTSNSSDGHGTVDTPPTTVEDLAEDDDHSTFTHVKIYDDSGSDGYPFSVPESPSSFHSARTHLSDV